MLICISMDRKHRNTFFFFLISEPSQIRAQAAIFLRTSKRPLSLTLKLWLGERGEEWSRPRKGDKYECRGFPGGSLGKEPTCNAGNARDAVSVPGLGWSPGGGHGYPLQYSCLENPMDRGAWRGTVHRVTKIRHCWRDWAPMRRTWATAMWKLAEKSVWLGRINCRRWCIALVKKFGWVFP